LNSQESEDSGSLLLRDYEQAWEHLRHVETVRIQYTGFFFTIVLGSIALAVPLFVQRAESSPALVIASCFAGALTTFSSSLYLSMRRMGVQLRHYRRSIEKIRNHYYGGSVLDEDLKAHFAAEALAKQAGAIQRTNELIILSFTFATLLVELLIVSAIFIEGGRWWQTGIAIIVFLGSAVPVGVAARWSRR